MRFALPTLAAALLVAAAGCGGGGGGTSGSSVKTTPPSPASTDGQFAVQFDYNDDEHQDMLTLDSTVQPMRIVSVMDGGPNGTFTDTSAALRPGQSIDASLSSGLATYLANSIDVGSGTEVQIRDSMGRDVTVTVYE